MGWSTREAMVNRLDLLEAGQEPALEEPEDSTQPQQPQIPEKQMTAAAATKKKALKIAIVSNTDHAKSLTQALRAEGHIGFNFPDISGEVPSSMDVIVCRTKSISHRAYGVCIEERRKGVRPVVFENGVTRAVEAIRAIAEGTWIAPSLATDEDDASSRSWADGNRPGRLTGLEVIEEVIDKGGLFFTELIRRSPSQARDALQCVVYDKKDRVKRTAVFDALNEFNAFSPATIEAQFEALQAEGKYPAGQIWWTETEGTGIESLLMREPLTQTQLQQLASGLTRPGRVYTVNEPVELKEMLGLEPEPQTALIEEPVLEEPIESEPEPIAPVPEPEPVPAPVVEVAPTVMDPKHEKELLEYLEIVATHLDLMNLSAIPVELLRRTGLWVENGLIALSIVHMAAPNGVCCGGPGTKTSLVPEAVTCPACQKHSFFAFASWYAKARI